MPNFPQRFLIPALLFLLLVIILLVYWSGLSGDFIFDDIINISLNSRSHLKSLSFTDLSEAWHSGIASDLGRPLSMLSFGLNYYFSGLNPAFYKLTNVLIHLLTAVVVYFLSLELLGIKEARRRESSIPKEYLALLITACWALHPLHASTVLYAVQRMTQLAALFSFLSLLVYCRARQRTDITLPQILLNHAGIGLLIILGLLSKENAVLIIPLIAVIEFSLFTLKTNSPRQRLFQKSFFILFLFIPGLIIGTYLLLNPAYVLAGYSEREFSLYERLLTESRILWDYLGWILITDTRDYVFFHENYPISTGLLSPPSTLFAIVGILLLIAMVFLLRKSLPWISFGIGFFLAGHALESTVFALELVFEHRNYLPAYGIIFGLIATLFTSPLQLLNKRVGLAFSTLFMALLLQGTYVEALKWANTPNFLLTLLTYSPDSYRINYTTGHMYEIAGKNLASETYLRESQKYYSRAIELDQRSFASHVGLMMINDYFGEATQAQIVNELLQRIRENGLTSSDLIALTNIVNCYFSGNCDQQVELLPRILNGIVQNQIMPFADRQDVLDYLAANILVNFKRIDDALAIYYMAENLSDNLSEIDLKIIFLELQKQNYSAAQAHMLKAKSKPANPTLQNGLERLEELSIEELRN